MDFKAEIQSLISQQEAEILGVNINSNRFDPKLDFVFKAIFTSDREESRIARIDFLSAILKLDIESADVIQNELAVLSANEKKSTFDIHIRLTDKTEINVEIQLKNDDNMINRAEYYTCKMYGSQEAKGKAWADLHKVIELMIVNFTLFSERKEFLDEYTYRNKEGKELSGNTKIYFLELTKLANLLKKPVDEMTAEEMWAIFLKFGNNEKHYDVIKQISKRRRAIDMAGQVLDTISSDRATQLMYMDRMKFETDQISKVIFAERKGRSEGLREGRREGMLAIARNLKNMGLAIDDIVKGTGLSSTEIEQL